MSITYNGQEINAIDFNGHTLDSVMYNGVEVFKAKEDNLMKRAYVTTQDGVASHDFGFDISSLTVIFQPSSIESTKSTTVTVTKQTNTATVTLAPTTSKATGYLVVLNAQGIAPLTAAGVFTPGKITANISGSAAYMFFGCTSFNGTGSIKYSASDGNATGTISGNVSDYAGSFYSYQIYTANSFSVTIRGGVVNTGTYISTKFLVMGPYTKISAGNPSSFGAWTGGVTSLLPASQMDASPVLVTLTTYWGDRGAQSAPTTVTSSCTITVTRQS